MRCCCSTGKQLVVLAVVGRLALALKHDLVIRLVVVQANLDLDPVSQVNRLVVERTTVSRLLQQPMCLMNWLTKALKWQHDSIVMWLKQSMGRN